MNSADATPGAPTPGLSGFPSEAFADIVAANSAYTSSFRGLGLDSRAARGLAIVTCMDSRIDPLRIVGMAPGDAKILRNAGARVTDDVLRTLVLATYLLDVTRVLVLPHTRCKMVGTPEDEIHRIIGEQYGVDTASMEFRTVEDEVVALRRDLRRVRSFPLLPRDLVVGGAVYDVDTGAIHPVDG